MKQNHNIGWQAREQTFTHFYKKTLLLILCAEVALSNQTSLFRLQGELQQKAKILHEDLTNHVCLCLYLAILLISLRLHY